MAELALHQFHQAQGGRFAQLNGCEVVADFGDVLAEHGALVESAGLLDLSFRGRICLTGTERVRFLHGQVTNDIKRLRAGTGCYAALTSAKGKFQSDLNIYLLEEELLLDFEPGLLAMVSERFEKYIVADDVQVVEVSSAYGLMSVQGPQAAQIVEGLGLARETPATPFHFIKIADPALGDIYVMNQPRLGSQGFDLFVPVGSLGVLAERVLAVVQAGGGRLCGWQALELARIEAGIPRFGADMDESNLPLECGIEQRAISYNKGCYIGQEVLNRIHTLGHVNKELRGLRLPGDLDLPMKGDKLFWSDKEVGYVTSAIDSPTLKAKIALAYVRREANQVGTELLLQTPNGKGKARIVGLPFRSE
jgi:folate-binding protein YgfZ